jgi:hypothetical protein
MADAHLRHSFIRITLLSLIRLWNYHLFSPLVTVIGAQNAHRTLPFQTFDAFVKCSPTRTLVAMLNCNSSVHFTSFRALKFH